MGERKGLWSKLWDHIDPLVPDEQIRAGAHALGGAVKRSAQAGLLHNVAAIPGALTGRILRELNGPAATAATPQPLGQTLATSAPYAPSDVPSFSTFKLNRPHYAMPREDYDFDVSTPDVAEIYNRHLQRFDR